MTELTSKSSNPSSSGGGDTTNRGKQASAGQVSIAKVAEGRTSSLQVLHQSTKLLFEYMPCRNEVPETKQQTTRMMNNNKQWSYVGKTTLYVIDHCPSLTGDKKGRKLDDINMIERFAIHFRKQHMKLNKVRVFAMDEANEERKNNDDTSTTTSSNATALAGRKRKIDDSGKDGSKMSRSKWSYYELVEIPNVVHIHADPMQKILRSSYPPNNIFSSNGNNTEGSVFFDADKHSNRSGAGFALNLRAATIASTEGECKIGFLSSGIPQGFAIRDDNNQERLTKDGDSNNKEKRKKSNIKDLLQASWRHELQHSQGDEDDNDSFIATKKQQASKSRGAIERRLHRRTFARRHQRFDVISKKLADATLHGNTNAYKIVLEFAWSYPSNGDEYDSSVVSKVVQPRPIVVPDGGIHFVTPSPPSSSSLHAPHQGTTGNHNIKKNDSLPTYMNTPHVYTSTGSGQGGSSIYGDPSSGPRCWIPCIDSPSMLHKCSHEIIVSVKAPMEEGLKAVVCGEDFCDQIKIYKSSHNHDDSSDKTVAATGNNVTGNNVHIVAPTTAADVTSPMPTTPSFFWVAHHTVASVIYEPIPARCLGLAIGPFEFVTDPECLEEDSDDEEDDDEEEDEAMEVEQQQRLMSEQASSSKKEETTGGDSTTAKGDDAKTGKKDDQNSKQNETSESGSKDKDSKNTADKSKDGTSGGTETTATATTSSDSATVPAATTTTATGTESFYRKSLRGAVRQAYFAPVKDRRYIHSFQKRDSTSKTSSDDALDRAIRNTMIYSTSGVALRALSLMPVLLGHPNNQLCRIYTQVWIPHSIDGGGYGVGLPHQCSSHNSWLGGCVLDTRLLPPLYKRLPYYHGGRLLQLAQARNVIWMWIKSTISIGSDTNNLTDHSSTTSSSSSLSSTSNDNTRTETSDGSTRETKDTTPILRIGDLDEVGDGYLFEIFYQYLLYLYEMSYGACGEGGSEFSMFHTSRYANADPRFPSLVDNILAMENVEEEDETDVVGVGVVGNATVAGLTPLGGDDALRTLFRVPTPSCSESRSGAIEECVIRNCLRNDTLEAIHRHMEKVPLPCMGWNNAGGSLLSLTYLASLSTNATYVGCGTMDATHHTQMLYKEIKGGWLAQMIAARAGTENLLRVIRACVLVGSIYNGLGLTKVPTGVKELDSPTLVDPSNSNSSSNDNGDDDHNKNKDSDDVKNEDGGNENEADDDGNKANSTPVVRTPRFVLMLNEMMKRGGITHTVFTKAIRLLAGPTKEIYLNGSLLDIGRDVLDASGSQINVPEGFPNSYVRGASNLYLRAGLHVEPAGADGSAPGGTGGGGAGASSSTSAAAAAAAASKGTHLQIFAEPAIPSDGIVFAGPMTIRVVENENTCREFIRTLNVNGSLNQWGPIFLHSKPVTSAKAQMAASGSLEASTTTTGSAKKGKKGSSKNAADASSTILTGAAPAGGVGSAGGGSVPGGAGAGGGGAFTPNMLHRLGYQALELVRLLNRTPLLWCKIDPAGLYGGRIAMNQPDACWGEMLFHDGDPCGQIEAIRALAERPMKIQGSVNLTHVYDANVSELPIRLLGDCLRGSAALHSSLPHPPTLRAQAALAMAQWQNNKAPETSSPRYDSDEQEWIGLKLLLQYFYERFTTTDHLGQTVILPCKYWRETIQRNEGGDYTYMDEIDKDEEEAIRIRSAAMTNLELRGESILGGGGVGGLLGEDGSMVANGGVGVGGGSNVAYPKIDREEDEEYRVRSAVITAIASIRAKDGQTPQRVVEFFERLLPVCDGTVFATRTEGTLQRRYKTTVETPPMKVVGLPGQPTFNFCNIDDLEYIDQILVANTLLALCYINVTPNKPTRDLNDVILSGGGAPPPPPPPPAVVVPSSSTIPTEGGGMSSSASSNKRHPVQTLIDLCQQWLDWSLYQEAIARGVEHETGCGVGEGQFSIVAPSAITALVSLVLLKQSTTTKTSTSSTATTAKKGEASVGLPSETTGSANKSSSGAVVVAEDDDDEQDGTVVVKDVVTKTSDDVVVEKTATAKFYLNILDATIPVVRSDITRAAAAQAVACIYCASDRQKGTGEEALGLLTALEVLLARANDPMCSKELRQTLVAIMMDACTGKVCSTQRIATLGGRGDHIQDVARYLCGPLGSSHGGDNGSALLLTVGHDVFPAANAVNDGARMGLKLLMRAGLDNSYNEVIVVRVAKFATNLWRTMNGETAESLVSSTSSYISSTMTGTSNTPSGSSGSRLSSDSACASDSHLRTSLLALWQWIWPKACYSVMRVQSWLAMKDNAILQKRCQELGAHDVMTLSPKDKASASEEEKSLGELQLAVQREIERQTWRCEMSSNAYDVLHREQAKKDHGGIIGSEEGGVNQPLPPVKKDAGWRNGGWVASVAQQRREKALDGGTSVTKLRLNIGSKSTSDP